jgi:hypothetical protein
MNDMAETPGNREAGPLAREMAAGLRERVESYLNAYDISPQEAAALVLEPKPPEEAQRALRVAPEHVSWEDLAILLRHDQERALARWEEIKQAARDEVSSGHRGAKLVQRWGGSPWQRADYLAFLDELADGWQPRNGIERQLLEVMAQAQTAAEYWMGMLTRRSSLEGVRELAGLKNGKGWETSHVTEAQAVEQAAAMVDRFNRIFLRTLRALRDLRRGPQPVLVQNAGQVNVGQQQVNVAGGGP